MTQRAGSYTSGGVSSRGGTSVSGAHEGGAIAKTVVQREGWVKGRARYEAQTSKSVCWKVARRAVGVRKEIGNVWQTSTAR